MSNTPTPRWNCKGCGVFLYDNQERVLHKNRSYCSQSCIDLIKQCTLGDILEGTLEPLHFIRSNDSKRVEGLGKTGEHKARELHDGNFYFHRPRTHFAKCPLCDKRIGRKSNFRYQLIVRHIKSDNMVTLILKVVHRNFDKKNPIGAGPWSIHDPDLITKIIQAVAKWNDKHKGALKCQPEQDSS